jgi:hypothetical protein
MCSSHALARRIRRIPLPPPSEPRQNVILTDAALRCAAPWYTASMLLPSGSRTNAA